MHPGIPAQDLQEFIVQTKREGDAHDSQTDVGEHGDGTELEQAGQTNHQPREHHTGPPHVPPVQQINHCKTGQGGRQSVCSHATEEDLSEAELNGQAAKGESGDSPTPQTEGASHPATTAEKRCLGRFS